MKKVLGIIGGMGPMATADLFKRLIEKTPAKSDAEHIHIIVDDCPQTPDRTRAILHGGESPLPCLVASAKRLANAGAELLLLSCNTSHHYFAELAKASPVPILNTIEETAKFLSAKGIKKAGLLATDGTVGTRVFENVFDRFGIETVLPDADGQRAVMSLIYDGIKAGRKEFDCTDFSRALSDMTARGAETLVLGCTELPLAVTEYGISGSFTDPTDILADVAVAEALRG